MIPSPWVGLVLALATYRFARLVGWDDFPLAVKLRNWATDTRYHVTGSPNQHMNLTDQVPNVTVVVGRPVIDKLVSCPFCQGFWLSVLVYVCWHFIPAATLYVCAPFALSAVVGLLAKNLDP